MRRAWRTLGCLLLLALAARAAAPQGAADSRLRVAATEAGAFEVELLTIFARVHKLELEMVPTTAPADAMTALAQGRVRIAAGGVIAIGDQVDFSTEVFPTRLVALTRRPNPPVEFIEGLRGMRVGVPTGPVVTDALLAAKVRASSLDVFSTAAEALAALHAGRIGAAVVRLDEAPGHRPRFRSPGRGWNRAEAELGLRDAQWGHRLVALCERASDAASLDDFLGPSRRKTLRWCGAPGSVEGSPRRRSRHSALTAPSQTMAPAKLHQASDAGTTTTLGSESIRDLIG